MAREIENQVRPYLMEHIEKRRREIIEARKMALTTEEKDEIIRRNWDELTEEERRMDTESILERAIDLETNFKELITDQAILEITKSNLREDLDSIVPEVEVDDIVTAAEMVLPHRMRRQPLEEEEFSYDLLLKLVEDKL
ncbi:MAG TPA: hypothetical protein EYP29_01465 [Thermoplasmata archaeon]|nr:hypothetical protein [Thermoplasmata archaeon]